MEIQFNCYASLGHLNIKLTMCRYFCTILLYYYYYCFFLKQLSIIGGMYR